MIEVLVAVAVLALLTALLLEISSTTFAATRLTHSRIEAQENARQVLDAVSQDCLDLIARNGAPLLVGSYVPTSTPYSGLPANLQLAFLTQGRGPTSASRYLAISYRLNAGNVERLSQSVDWPASPPVTTVSTVTSALNATSDAAPTSVSVISTGILRFVAVAELSDGSIVPLTPLPTATWAPSAGLGGAPPASQPFVALNLTTATLPRVRSITLAVASIDAADYKLMTATPALALSNLTALNTAFIVPPADTVNTPPRCSTPVEIWENALRTNQLASLPKPVVAAVHLVQKTYFLNP